MHSAITPRTGNHPHGGDGRLGERLAESRWQRGFAVKELASAAGISERTYRDWESGRTVPHLGSRLMRVAAALRVSHTWLLEGDEEEEND